MRRTVGRPARLEGTVVLPGDKSISHRALLLNALARGSAHVSNLCHGDDRASMLRCLRGLGTRIVKHSDCVLTGAGECFRVHGRGKGGFDEPSVVLNAGNSATTLRLTAGLLAAQPFFSVISGDRSLRSRPMGRIVAPLTEMGATVTGRRDSSLAPLAIRGGGLRGIVHEPAESSAQVKSCVLVAGLHAGGVTTVRQPSRSRDHTERMMKAMGADLVVDGLAASVRRSELRSIDVRVPGDTSAAAFWLVAAICHPNARVVLEGVGINPTRTGIVDILRSMGAQVRVENEREDAGEPSADLVAESSDLSAVEISGDIIPRMIDELPVLALAACFARGRTVIRDAQELRVKESDRIAATVDGLSRLGARVEERPDGMVIDGGRPLAGTECDGFGDHRIAMTMGIAGLLAEGETVVSGAEAAAVSYPGFWTTLGELSSHKR